MTTGISLGLIADISAAHEVWWGQIDDCQPSRADSKSGGQYPGNDKRQAQARDFRLQDQDRQHEA